MEKKEMNPWDGVVREGHGIMFDGKNFYEIVPPPGGYGPYHVWSGDKSVAIITQTQYKFQKSLEFWIRRREEQLQYFRELADRQFEWSGRMQQHLKAAFDVMNIIEENIKRLS